MNSNNNLRSDTLTTVASFENEPIERLFLDEINASYAELRLLLPSLPNQLRVIFGTNYDYGEDGVTGSAVSADVIKIGIDSSVVDRTKQYEKIRSLVFHEGYHLAQNFHLGSQFSAVESAIYEGCATIFERDYADSTPKWANYSKEDTATLWRWYEAMKDISAEQYFEPSGETWKKWAFYDAETNESWRVYKVGTWLVEDILKKNDLDIIDLSSMTASDILTYLQKNKHNLVKS
ncbi:hypothetical protein A2791_05865 [Candidatus Saccharibacteria bacterium RIFCSPHIGHO2_01_FULL_46_30]|nr:MAG: hypothetical protein A2791_05865 [Candidatus Saccharibacteria bacterium RIFCSPHIGHO2_01_FULL_46_30]